MVKINTNMVPLEGHLKEDGTMDKRTRALSKNIFTIMKEDIKILFYLKLHKFLLNVIVFIKINFFTL